MIDASQLPADVPIDAFYTQEQQLQPGELIEMRMDFALHSLTHVQNLVRFMDQKAGLTLSAVGILTTAQGAFLVRIFDVGAASQLQQLVYMAILSAAVIYTLTAFGVIFAGTRVFTPSVAPKQTDSQSLGLIFPLAILRRYNSDEARYHAALIGARPSELLLDLSNQIIEVSNVFAAKNRHLTAMFRRFRTLCMLWLVLMMLLVLSDLVV